MRAVDWRTVSGTPLIALIRAGSAIFGADRDRDDCPPSPRSIHALLTIKFNSEEARIMSYRLLAAVLILVMSRLGFAEDPPAAANRPRLGLVLEGGGALGLAHIGIIEYLEEHHIPVNYIAGTSMGGLVGGAYATGLDAKEVRELVTGIDWNQVIGGQVPFSDLSFRRKQDAHEYPSNLELGLRNGLEWPSGFNSGQGVQMVLDRIALPYSNLKSFDELPIPFACVATDLVAQEAHVFRDGPLSLALRSTMSLPGFFSPVRSGDHIYVDGGLLDNIPIGLTKEMGADYVLGIHLETASLKPDASLSALGVLTQSIAAMIAANEKRSMGDADLIVRVPLQKFTAMNYDKANDLIRAGYAAAEANAAKLAPLSVDDETWRSYLREREARRRKAVTPQFVEVTGVPAEIAQPLTEQMSDHAGQPVDTAKLDRDIMLLNGTGPFSSFDYSMVEKGGQPGLNLEAHPKLYQPPIVRPLILINGADYNNVLFTMGARITFLDFGGYRRELRNDLVVGSQYELRSEYYRPFQPTSGWFVAPRIDLTSFQYPVYDGDTFLTLYRERWARGGLDLGYSFGRVAEWRLGYEGGYLSLKSEIGSISELPKVAGTTGDVRMQFQYTTLDDPVIPHAGENVTFSTKYFHVNPGAPEGFPVSELKLQNFFQFTRRSTAFLNADGGSSYGFNAGIPAFQLGGGTRFVAYGTNELQTNQYVLGQVGYIRKLRNLPPVLGSTIDLLGVLEVGQTYQLPFGPKPPHVPGDVVGAFVVNTIFGPVEVGGAVGNYGHGKFFFQVGRIF